jgi:hypothetical protein
VNDITFPDEDISMELARSVILTYATMNGRGFTQYDEHWTRLDSRFWVCRIGSHRLISSLSSLLLLDHEDRPWVVDDVYMTDTRPPVEFGPEFMLDLESKCTGDITTLSLRIGPTGEHEASGKTQGHGHGREALLQTSSGGAAGDIRTSPDTVSL